MGGPTYGASAASEPIGNTRPGRAATALQAHAGFFDFDGDGIIWPLDTYQGCREIGFGIILATMSMILIHVAFSWTTWGTWLPDPFFRLKIKFMHRGKHGSDTGSYTYTGEFDEARFNVNWNLYSSPPHKDMSFWEGVRMVYGNRDAFDPYGWLASVFEWLGTYIMLWPENGRVKKGEIRAVYDGSIFYRLSGREQEWPMESETHGVAQRVDAA
ncbi:hypothetical protein AX16_009377 [Volvariella volvacea WC 439]|nr:hypothetical protein AX16_009377 [Volvariella volvacea WC 439]